MFNKADDLVFLSSKEERRQTTANSSADSLGYLFFLEVLSFGLSSSFHLHRKLEQDCLIGNTQIKRIFPLSP